MLAGPVHIAKVENARQAPDCAYASNSIYPAEIVVREVQGASGLVIVHIARLPLPVRRGRSPGGSDRRFTT